MTELGGLETLPRIVKDFPDVKVLILSGHANEEYVLRALRSGAANIGAQGVYEMCLSWRRIDPATLSSKGPSYLRELEQELARVRAARQDYRDYRAARKRFGLAAPETPSGATPLRA